MPRSAKEEQEEGAPAWILSYADLTQQLLCMFVLMFAMMKVDVTKAALIGQAFGTGMPPSNETESLLTNPVFTEKVPQIYEAGARYEAPQEGIDLLVKKVHEGTKITVEGVYQFDEGKAELSEEFKRGLDFMAEKFLRDYLNVIDVRGFTSGNTEDAIDGDHALLSYYRAKNVADYLISQKEKNKIDQKRIRVTACGANEPIADSLDVKKREKNRRVEVIVSEELIQPPH